MSGLDISDLKDGEENPRAFKRFNVQFSALVARIAGHEQAIDVATTGTVQALVTNISMSGLHFASPLEFPVDAVLEINITIGTMTYPVPVVVRRSRPNGRPGRFAYTAGAQYIKSPYTAAFVPTLAKYLVTRGFLKSA